MRDFTIEEIKVKYLEYKEILEGIEDGDYLNDYTIEQIEMMHQIVTKLNDMGFNLICQKLN